MGKRKRGLLLYGIIFLFFTQSTTATVVRGFACFKLLLPSPRVRRRRRRVRDSFDNLST